MAREAQHPRSPTSTFFVLLFELLLAAGERLPHTIEAQPPRLPRLTFPVLDGLDVSSVREAAVGQHCALQIAADVRRELIDVDRSGRNRFPAVRPGNPVLAQVVVFVDAVT